MSINYGYFDHSANDLIGKNMNSRILKYDIYIIGCIRTYMKDLLWKRNYSIKTQSHIIKYVFITKIKHLNVYHWIIAGFKAFAKNEQARLFVICSSNYTFI